MRIISIKASTFESMMERFESFTRKVDALCRQNGEKSFQQWFDNQEVCQILNISRRTLQEYRIHGRIPYIQLGGKIIYRESDIQKMLEDGYKGALK